MRGEGGWKRERLGDNSKTKGGEAAMCTKEMKRAGLQRVGDWVQWQTNRKRVK